MARPRKSEHNREQLLELGASLFMEKGYSGAGIKEILGTVGVPRGSFYNYFESKEQYAAEVIRHYTDRMATQIETYVSTANEPPMKIIENIPSMIMAVAEESGCQGCLMGSLAGEIAANSELCRQAMLEGMSRWRTGFEELFAEAQSSGEMRADLSAAALVELFWNQWQGALLKMQIEDNTEALESSFADFLLLIRA
ncbi:MAG: TetR family transcriptional regulator C-terminal domain-containing protein [Pseudomonadales bacterium]|nr:TetR family transcriptional regulator C-terminal domain-containing protein [Pseudomonadales bacterium]